SPVPDCRPSAWSARWSLPGSRRCCSNDSCPSLRRDACGFLPSCLQLLEHQRGIDETNVRKCLRIVAERLAIVRIELLGIQANVVGVAEQLFEQADGLRQPARSSQSLDRPEAGDAEPPFAAGQTIQACFVAEDEQAAPKPPQHLFHGRAHTS